MSNQTESTEQGRQAPEKEPGARPEFLGRAALGGAFVVSAITVVAVLVLSIVATLLLALSTLDHGLSQLTSQAGIPASTFTDTHVSAQVLPIFLLIGSLSLLGDVSISLSGGGGVVHGVFAFTPLLLTATIALITAWAGYGAERRSRTTTRSGLLLLSVASGLGVAIVWTLLVAIAHPSVSAQGAELSLSSGDFRTFLGALLLISASALLGRWVARGDRVAGLARFPRELAARLSGTPAAVHDAITALLTGAVVFGVVALVGGVIGIGTQVGWGTAFGTLLLWWGPATVLGAVIGQFRSPLVPRHRSERSGQLDQRFVLFDREQRVVLAARPCRRHLGSGRRIADLPTAKLVGEANARDLVAAAHHRRGVLVGAPVDLRSGLRGGVRRYCVSR